VISENKFIRIKFPSRGELILVKGAIPFSGKKNVKNNFA